MFRDLQTTARRHALVALFVSSSFALQAGAALAQDETSPADELLPRVIVSATRVPTPEDEVASSVTLITAADIEAQQARTLPDILQTVPGLNVVQTGGPGGATSVFIRGTNSNHVKILVDGIDIAQNPRAARARIGSELDAAQTGNDVAALGTPTEREQWARIARLEEQLATLPPSPEREEARDKLRLIKGVLYWRLDASFKVRGYEPQRALRELDAQLEELQNRWVRVQQARTTAPNDTGEFAARIAALAARIQSMRERLAQASQQQNHYLESVAESQLQAQKERLDAYALQARFALADIYDRAADQAGEVAAPAAAPASAPAPAKS